MHKGENTCSKRVNKMNLKDREWKEFSFHEIFPEIQRGKRLKKADHKKGQMPYVSSTAFNNGVDGFVSNKEKVRIFSDCLTIANSGSVGACFYQPYKFVASDHVTKLENENLSKYTLLFISTITSRLSEKYSFNREINDKRIQREKVLLPVTKEGIPDYDFMDTYMREKEQEKKQKYKKHVSKLLDELESEKDIPSLSDKNWDEFFISDIFDIKPGERLTKADMKKGNKPFIGSTDSNNGITEYTSNTNNSEDMNVLGVNYNGSVVENFYHPYKALFSDDVKRLSLKEVEGNKYIYLFIKALILKQKDKYKYGYKFNETRMNKQKIMLPVKENGEPDYDYMENYIKKLELEKLKKYLT